jgi:hypothetical protein
VCIKGTVIPVNSGVIGIGRKRSRKNLKDVAGKHSVDPLQNTAALGTSHVIGKVL